MQDSTTLFNINTVLNHINHTYCISFNGTLYEKYISAINTMYKSNPKLFINNKKVSFIPHNNWKFSKVRIPGFINRTEHERTPICTFYTIKTNNKLNKILDNLCNNICSLVCIELNKIYFSSSLDPVGARALIKKLDLKYKFTMSNEIWQSIKIIKFWIKRYGNYSNKVLE